MASSSDSSESIFSPSFKVPQSCYADYRSDTVTQPCIGMYQAMCVAPLGDDVFIDDPTTLKLEALCATMTGKEAGLFMPTGSMSNQIAVHTHLHRRKPQLMCPEVVLDKRSHIYNYECGGLAFHSRASIAPVQPSGEFLTAEEVEAELKLEYEIHHVQTGLVCLENALNGNVHSLDEMKRIYAMVHGKGLPLHLDGARLWNASVASGVPFSEYGLVADTISLCMSKGLGAPGGTVLVGDRDFIEQARQFRKLFGGGMRQCGILAGAALYGIEHYWGENMLQTHKDARYMGEELEKIGFSVRYTETNQVWVNCAKLNVSWHVLEREMMARHEIKILAWDADLTRLCVHYQTQREHVNKTVECLKELLALNEKGELADVEEKKTGTYSAKDV
eukprot:TRINITY_DN3610_c0_g1_i2.p1 TRINITY_DN3610_c0_g1~~TRINITY_DN3610_c0_g1_i2.p1  ORF type:complete len:390 (+),score=83.54 TRINITY_DN3610_c0_g1_i2:59-1228(+)